MRKKYINVFLFVALIMFPSETVKAEKTVYTYNYDYWALKENHQMYTAMN